MLKGPLIMNRAAGWVWIIAPPLLVFIGVFWGGTQYLDSQPKDYEANARIWVQTKGIPVESSSSDGGSGQFLTSPLTSGSNPLTTACEVVCSEAVVSEAHEILARQLPPKECPPIFVIKALLEAIPVKDADIVTISYESGNPKVALAVVQAVIEAFYKENNIQTASNATQSKTYLEKQLKQVREQYTQASDRLQKFQETHHAIDLTSQAGAMLEEKADIDRTISETKQDIAAKESKLKYLEKQLGFNSSDVLTVDTLARDEVLKGLRKTVAENEVKLIGLRSKYQEEHPKMKSTRTALSTAQQAMANRMKVLIGEADPKFNSETIGNDSEVRGGMLQQVAEINSELVAAKQRVLSLTAMLGQVNSSMTAVPAQQNTLAELTRAEKLAEESLSAVERELQNVSLTESVAMGTSNLQIIDHPSVTDKAVSGQKFVLMFALILAALTAAAQYFLDPKVRSVKQIWGLLPFSVVAWVANQGPRSGMQGMASSFQRLRISIKTWAAEGRKLMLIASACPGDGKSTIAHALALSLSASGQRVMLIDANLKHPSLHVLCGQQGSPGLADYLKAPTPVEALRIVHNINENLNLIPAGELAPDTNVLMSKAFTDLLNGYSEEVDVFVVDTPATGHEINSLTLPDEISFVVVAVVRLNHTIKSALKLLAGQVSLLASAESIVVINDVDEKTIASAVVSPAASIQGPLPAPSSAAAPAETSLSANW